MKVTPINTLLKEVYKLSKYPDSNKEELDKLRNKVIKQKEVFDKISFTKLEDELKNPSITNQEYSNYKDLYNEKKKYIKNSLIIDNIIKEEYDKVKIKREVKRNKIRGIVIISSLALTLGGIVTFKRNNNSNNKNISVVSNETTIDNINNTEEKLEVVNETTTEEIKTTSEEELKKENEEELKKGTTEEIKTDANTENIKQENSTEVSNVNTTEEEIEILTTQEVKTTETKKENNTEVDIREDILSDDIDPELINDFANTVVKFDHKMDEIEQSIIDPEKRENAKKEAKEKFITLVDFMFYDGEINGKHFSDLKDDTKEKLFSLLQRLDTIIMKYDPDYKESIGEKYNVVKDFTSTKLDQAKEYFKNKIGEDKYNKINDTKDKIVDGVKDTGSKTLKFINDKYQNFKNKEEDTE